MSPQKRSRPACAMCGSRNNIEHNHIGGRNHLIWVTGPLCQAHHRQFHTFLENLRVDLAYTADPIERLMRASKAITILLCMVQNAMHELILKQPQK
jgi:hypothetical protein